MRDEEDAVTEGLREGGAKGRREGIELRAMGRLGEKSTETEGEALRIWR